MGFLFLESFGNVDTQIVELIAKEHKVSIEIVEKHYKEMLEAIKNETEE